MIPKEQLELAKEMYDVYCDAVGGKAFNGDDLPKSEDFFNDGSKQKQQLGWFAAAAHALYKFDKTKF